MANDKVNTGFNPDAVTAQENSSVEQNDAFWSHATIDSSRWNQSFPYQLLLVRKNGNQYTDQDEKAKKWRFTLPIPPNSIAFSMPFAISGEVKLDGYHEQHGGAPIRMITLSGTTGVLPNKGTAEIRQTQPLVAGILAGTITSAKRSAGSLVDLVSGVGTKPNIVSDNEFNGLIGDTSGYVQWRRLQEFFENYVAFKKTSDGKNYCLALAIWKDQAVYLVTPVNFTVPRTADSPFEYPYSLSFRAWRRVTLSSNGPAAANYKPVSKDATKLGKLIGAIDRARQVLEGAVSTIQAFVGDVDRTLLQPLRSLSLFVRDLAGVPLAFADLPDQIVKEGKTAVIAAAGIRTSWESQFADADQDTRDIATKLNALSAKTNQGTSLSGLQLDALTGTAATDSVNDIFDNPSNYYSFFSRLNVANVQLPPTLVRAIVNERDKVRQMTRLDFEQMRDSFVQLMADYADAVGAGNTTFANTYSRSLPTTTRTPSTGDYQVIFAMNRVVMELNRLAASSTINRFQINSIDYVAGLASRSGIAFTVPQSKFAVPYPYGMTIEQLATRYLGDPDRWIEIATLNGLRAPYVDEEGFDLPLLTNGRDNQVEVADASNLYIGQLVWIRSTTAALTSRHILKIETLNSGQSILTLDGDADLDSYSTLSNAQLHAFLPDTVNSMMQIYIPSSDEPQMDDWKTKSIPGVDQFDPLVEAGGVDLLLTESGDLAITPDGDCRLAIGLTNIVQTARIRLSVTQGELNRHPQFGLAIKVGASTADVNVKQLLQSCQDLFADDNTFTSVSSLSILKQGNTASISLQIGVRGVSQLVPVTFQLQP
jgi:hypothetical protein